MKIFVLIRYLTFSNKFFTHFHKCFHSTFSDIQHSSTHVSALVHRGAGIDKKNYDCHFSDTKFTIYITNPRLRSTTCTVKSVVVFNCPIMHVLWRSDP